MKELRADVAAISASDNRSHGSSGGDLEQTKILVICALDVMAWKGLRDNLRALRDHGYEVHISGADTGYFAELRMDGFRMHDVRFRRQMNPLLHFGPVWTVYKLIRTGRFTAVNTHSPVAAAIGRVSAWMARTPVVNTVHGFYFHEGMPPSKRRAFVLLEWLLGRLTDSFMFVSDEDRQTALREGIAKDEAKTVTIYNGVDIDTFAPRSDGGRRSGQEQIERRAELNIPENATVVGIVGRIVREKGYLEFAEMARTIAATRPNVYFLIVGAALCSDRDGIGGELNSFIEAEGLEDRIRFSGFTLRVADYLRAMDIFVLPSYREGFPCSILEAMSCALPVVASDIRGCREAVAEGETGLLVPPRNGKALAEAVNRLLEDSAMAIRMGLAGRARAEQLYNVPTATSRFVNAVTSLVVRTGRLK